MSFPIFEVVVCFVALDHMLKKYFSTPILVFYNCRHTTWDSYKILTLFK